MVDCVVNERRGCEINGQWWLRNRTSRQYCWYGQQEGVVVVVLGGLKNVYKNLRLQFSGASHNSTNKFVAGRKSTNEKERERVKKGTMCNGSLTACMRKCNKYKYLVVSSKYVSIVQCTRSIYLFAIQINFYNNKAGSERPPGRN